MVWVARILCQATCRCLAGPKPCHFRAGHFLIEAAPRYTWCDGESSHIFFYMVGERPKPESDPNNWQTVVRSQGPGYGEDTIWEWAVYPEKDAVVPLLCGAVKGPRQKAFDAAMAAVTQELDKRAKRVRSFKKKRKKAK